MNHHTGIADGLMVKMALKAFNGKIDIDTDTMSTQALMAVRLCMSREIMNVVHLLCWAHKLLLVLISATRANGDGFIELDDYC